jgi:hypothetical protein
MVQGLANSAKPIRSFALSTPFNKLGTRDLQQFRVKMGASLVTGFIDHYIALSRLLLEHGNG